jgi:hypothetical protein
MPARLLRRDSPIAQTSHLSSNDAAALQRRRSDGRETAPCLGKSGSNRRRHAAVDDVGKGFAVVNRENHGAEKPHSQWCFRLILAYWAKLRADLIDQTTISPQPGQRQNFSRTL